MATRAEVEAARRALQRLSGAAQATLAALLAEVGLTDRARLERALRATFPALLAQYESASTALGASVAELWATELGLRPKLAVAEPFGAARAAGLAAWATQQHDPAAEMADITDRLTKRGYRETVQRTAKASRAAWARVPSGTSTCAFCLMVASRGAVYHSRDSAGDGHKYHGHCDCQVVLVRDESDLPDDYDLGALREVYSLGASAAESGGTRAVLAGIRQVTGSN